MVVMLTNYFIVPAPGEFRSVARVVSSHVTIDAAFNALVRLGADRFTVRIGSLRKGDTWRRVDEDTYPMAPSVAL